jgi:hypothetical protein
MPNIFGDWRGQLKIFFGYAQCFAYLSVTFDIPWPQSLLTFMNIMEFTAFDLYAVFGNISCRMQTGFLDKFVYHMALFPCILMVIGVVYLIARGTKCRGKYTNESLRTQVLALVSFVSFTLYTGISTRIFRLFKCRKVQETWYLTADYTVKCREGSWNAYAAVGVFCAVLFVIGIPAVQLWLLYRNRKNLHKDSCENSKLQRIVQKEYGSMYQHYKPECYYYDIVDISRRLLLTGGLIMMGEESVAQVFLGIVICTMWLCLLIYKQPYKATWDNVVAAILAAHLLLMLVSGMALKLYEATPGQDEYQRAGFGFVMIFVSVLCTLLGLGSILAGTPCLRECLMKRLMGTPKPRNRCMRQKILIGPIDQRRK